MTAIDVRVEQRQFLEGVFGDETGYLFVSTLDHDKKLAGRRPYWVDRAFAWPAQRETLLDYIGERDEARCSVYVAAQLYRHPNVRRKEDVKTCPSAWSDLDQAPPWKVTPEPSISVESSPGRYQGYWRAPSSMAPSVAEDFSRRIAYAHHAIGADLGGWDLTQVLRVPGTHNWKYPEAPLVKLLSCDPTPLPWTAFDQLPTAPTLRRDVEPSAEGDEPPVPLAGDELRHWQAAEADDRSGWAMRMVAILKDRGLSDRLVETALVDHPVYVAKAAEKWGGRTDLVVDDIRRCVLQWRRNPLPKIVRSSNGTVHPEPTIDDPTTGLDQAEVEPAWEFTVYPAGEFLNLELPVLDWLVPQYVEEGGIVILYGGTGTLKTYISTDLALALASGGLWCDRLPAKQCTVLLVQEDTPKARFQQRYLRPMVEARGLEPDSLNESLFVAPSTGLLLDEETRLQQLEIWISLHRPDFVILDAFYLLHRKDSRDGAALIPILHTIRRLREAYGCGFLVVDHSRKGGREKGDGDPIDDLYGGQEKGIVSEAMLQTLRIKGEPSCCFLYVRKLRGDVPPEPVRLRYEDGRLTVDGDLPETEDGTAKAIHEWLLRQGGSRTYEQISTGLDISQRSVERACGKLFRDHLVRRGKLGRQVTFLGLSSPMEDENEWPLS